MGAIRKVLNWYARLSPKYGKANPPYDHVVQIGDPTLRKICDPVHVDKICSKEIQKVLLKLQTVLLKHGSVGMSAPQIGVNMRIFAMNLSVRQLSDIPAEIVKNRGMTHIPLTIFINPKIKVLDYKKILFNEGCESVKGFAADVPRYKEVEVTGYNEKGELIKQQYKDWSARIAQHETDHLDGKLYVDIMDNKTLHCTCWQEVNAANGKITLPFY